MKGFLNSLMLILNMVAAGTLLFTYLSVHIPPDSFWMPALFGLFYPVFLIINLCFLFFWIFRGKWYFLISLIVVLTGWTWLSGTFQLTLRDSENVEGRRVNFLSYNVRFFDKYNWTNDPDAAEKILDFIVSKEPEIICLQEFSNSYQNALTSRTGNENIHFAAFIPGRREGMATLTSYPIIGKGEIRSENKSYMSIYTDIEVNSKVIRIYNIHLQSIHLDPVNYTLLDSLNLNEHDRNLREARHLLSQLKRAWIARSGQADQLSEHIASSPYPVIVCGDFNDTPVSYTYHKLSRGLKDAFIETGTGISKTYNGKFPSFRIDYILHHPDLQSIDYGLTKIRMSDHFPIHCTFII
jgi:endonuclease/exonuclease/phosphatase family metal-dependent hydrolase